MLSLKFPSLEKLLEKNTGELEADDPKRGICVKCGHAIISGEQFVLFFDLKDFFVKTFNFVDNNALKDLDAILDFMDGKMFSALFWKELTSVNVVSITDEGLSLDGMVKKDIYYKENSFDATEIRMLARSIKDSEDFNKSINTIFVPPLVSILTKLGAEVKKDTIILRTVGQNTQVQFTFSKNVWIYGVIMTDASVNPTFIFDYLKNFSEEVS